MKIKFEKPVGVTFSSLMWNDTFLLTEDGNKFFIKIPQMTDSPNGHVNAIGVGIKSNASTPFRSFVPDTIVFKVSITELTVVPEG